MSVTFNRNDPGDYDIKLDQETVGAILRERGRYGTSWMVRLPFPLGPVEASTLSEAQGQATRLLEEGQRTQAALRRFQAEAAPAAPPPPQEEPMAETAPTPEETRWASFIMNEQRHKRPVTPEDRKSAGEIMGRARRVSGRTGGGASHKPKASPLVVARAIKDIDAKVAEAQGINASREGVPVPAPEPPPITTPGGTPPEEIFRQSGQRVLVDLDRTRTALMDERAKLAERLAHCEAQIDQIEQRQVAIREAISG